MSLPSKKRVGWKQVRPWSPRRPVSTSVMTGSIASADAEALAAQARRNIGLGHSAPRLFVLDRRGRPSRRFITSLKLCVNRIGIALHERAELPWIPSVEPALPR